MKYFIDTEFIEGFHKPLFGKKRHFIDLISIGIVCEDGRTYSAISNEYKYKDADKWVQDNVITPLYISVVHGDGRNHCGSENFQYAYGKSNKQIAEEIVQFVFNDVYKRFKGSEKEFHSRTKEYGWNTDTPIEFYGYYADYDWVLFCSLFGRMIDLPKGFPMYCRDLKQMLDTESERCLRDNFTNEWESDPIIKGDIVNKGIPAFKSIDEVLIRIKLNQNYPKQTNEHNALADAKWNKELYNFLTNL